MLKPFAVMGLVIGLSSGWLGGGSFHSLAPSRVTAPWRNVTEVLREHEWADAINNLLDIVAAMPDTGYSLRPVPAMRSFGEVVGHITDVQYGFCDASLGIDLKRESWEKHPSKAEVIPALMASIAACDTAFDRLSDSRLTESTGKTIQADLFVTLLGHTRRETGKLVSYLPLRHIKPPEIHYQLGRKWRR